MKSNSFNYKWRIIMGPRVIVEKKSGGTWWKVLLGFLGGTIFGIGAVFGGVAAAGTMVKTKDLISLTGADANQILTAPYQEKTILEIVLDATGGKIKVNTLGDIAEITPLIDEYVTNVSTQLNALGTELTKEQIYSWPISELAEHLIDSVEQIELVAFLSKDKRDNPDPIVKYICYKTDDNGEYVLDDNGELIDLRLYDILHNSSFMQMKVNNLKIKMIFTAEEISKSTLLQAIGEKTVKELAKDGAFNDVKVADVVGSGSSSKIVEAFKREGTTIGGINESINNLYLDDVFDYKDYNSLPSVLKKLIAKDALGEFPGNKLTNPYTITKMTFDKKTGYPVEYDYVIFSDGTEENKTDYIPFSKIVNNKETGFIDKAKITIKDDLTVSYSGTKARDINDEKVTIDIQYPSTWGNLYAFSCNKPAKVKELDSAIDSLKLKDVMSIKPSDSMWKIRNEPVKDGESLFKSIKENMTLKDVLPNYENTKLLKAIPGTTPIGEINTAIDNMKLLDAFEDNIFGSDGKLNKLWKYMLIELEAGEAWIEGNPTKDSKPFIGYRCEEYTVGGDGKDKNPKGIDQLMTNMQNNMKYSEIKQLKADAIIDVTDTFVSTVVPTLFRTYIPDATKARHPDKDVSEITYGDMTIGEFTSMVSKVS